MFLLRVQKIAIDESRHDYIGERLKKIRFIAGDRS